MTSRPMTCGALEEHLPAYLSGGLTPEDENELARHLTACSACAAEVALAERVEVELAALPAFDVPPELITRIKVAARREPTPVVELASRRPRKLAWRAALAAGLLAALAVGWWQTGRVGRPSTAEIAAAEREARYALALVARLGRKASEGVRREVLVERIAVPVIESVGRSREQAAAVKTGGFES